MKPVCFIALTLGLILACGTESGDPLLAPEPSLAAQQSSSRWSSWSQPVNLGPVVNSPASDIGARLSPDERSLYFFSNRPGGMGGNDIWVAHRASHQSPWNPPVNLGPVINSAVEDGGPSLSSDGRMLFFQSGRPGGRGAADLYVSRRDDPDDDFGWGPPVNLGPLVNTAGGERGPEFVAGTGGEPALLYFNRGNIGLHQADLYAAPMSPDGEPLGPAELVANVNSDANDAGQSVRAHGRMILFWSERAGGFGDADLWVSTRRSVHDAWSTPTNLGAPPNTEFAEERPFLSHDGRTLFFDSLRPDGVAGSQDIWISTRLDDDDHGGEEVDDDDRDLLRFSDWSAPVNLGPVVNSPVGDIEVAISKDELSLYIASTRPGGLGDFDIWVSQRASVGDPWGPPQNLGPTINTAGRDQAPFLSSDGHRMYFFSDRPGGLGGTDLYVSQRRDKRDDFGWEAPQNLGSGVNGTANDVVPVVFEDEAGTVTLYFGSNRLGGSDIYASTLQPDGTFGPAALVEMLNSAGRDAPVTVRRDGLEMFLASDRPGTFGAFDLWVTTRASTSDSWSAPVNLGPVVNSAADDSRGALTRDGTTLYLESNRPGTLGGHDLWVSTRSRVKAPD
jgi:WD40 repeat protein